MKEDFADGKEPIRLMRDNKEIQKLIEGYRWMARKIAKFLIKLPITANQLSFFSVLTGIGATIFFIFKPTILNVMFAVFLLQLSVLLDYIDGEVARGKKQTSIFGKWMDINKDIFVEVIILFGISLGIYFQNPTPWILTLCIIAVAFRLLIIIAYTSTLFTIPSNYRKELFDHKKSFILNNCVLRQFILTHASMFFLASVLAIISLIFQPKIYGFGIMFWYIAFVAAYNIVFYLADVFFITIKTIKIRENNKPSKK